MLSKGLVVLKNTVHANSSKSVVAIAQKSFASNTKLEKFNYLDPLCLEELLTEEEKMIRDAAREYA